MFFSAGSVHDIDLNGLLSFFCLCARQKIKKYRKCGFSIDKDNQQCYLPSRENLILNIKRFIKNNCVTWIVATVVASQWLVVSKNEWTNKKSISFFHDVAQIRIFHILREKEYNSQYIYSKMYCISCIVHARWFAI